MNYTIKRDTKQIAGVDYFTAICTKPTPKAKYFKDKILWNYRFKTEQERETYIQKFEAKQKTFEQEQEERKQKFSEAKKNMVNPFKVGDLLYDSWGWEQTNIDFYQVVEVGTKSVKIRSIGQNMVRATGWASELVYPKKDDFQGEPETKILQMFSDGRPYIKSPHRGSITPWTNKAGEGVHQSHYA